MNDDDIKRLFSEIKKLKKELHEKGNGDYSKVNSKDILFYFLTQMNDLNKRVTRVESIQSIFMWLFPICIGVTGFICGIIF